MQIHVGVYLYMCICMYPGVCMFVVILLESEAHVYVQTYSYHFMPPIEYWEKLIETSQSKAQPHTHTHIHTHTHTHAHAQEYWEKRTERSQSKNNSDAFTAAGVLPLWCVHAYDVLHIYMYILCMYMRVYTYAKIVYACMYSQYA